MGTSRVDILIRQIREETSNQDVGPNAGISDTQIIKYINDAIHFLEEGITDVHANQFIQETFMDLVVGQEKYQLPDDFLPNGGIALMQYALSDPASTFPNWQKLKQSTNIERSSGWRAQIPTDYITVGSQFWVKPIPQTGKTNGLRLLYVGRLSRLDVRRGKVSTVTLNGSTNKITTLQVNTTTVTDPDEYDLNEYCCVVDADGNIKMAGIKLDGDLDGSGNVPVRSDFSYDTGETIAVGDYVVFGKNASTHQLVLDLSVERFLVSFASWKIQCQDSNNDSSQESEGLQAMRASILQTYAHPNQDVMLIPEATE